MGAKGRNCQLFRPVARLERKRNPGSVLRKNTPAFAVLKPGYALPRITIPVRRVGIALRDAHAELTRLIFLTLRI